MEHDEPSRPRDARASEAPDQGLPYATAFHAPVLCLAVLEALVTDRAGLYVDATLGGGGHSAALLDALALEGRVVGIDQDAEALAAAAARLAPEIEQDRFRALHGNFGDLERLLAAIDITEIDGLLLDLGISSHQIDEATRGFSHRAEARLDMRMDTRGGVTADEVVNRWSVADLRRALREFGEEPRAGRIAQAIVAARPVETTTHLADVVRSAVPTRGEAKALARVFQALRIVVNAELERLEQALAAGTNLLRPGGRMAVISYHSLEDRRVKRYFRYGNLEGEPVRDFYGNLLTPWRPLTRKPIVPDAAEVVANPRARSARLRIAERLPDSNDDFD